MSQNSSDPKRQKLIFTTTFSMLAKLIDADGTFTQDEVDTLNNLMKDVLALDGERKAYAVKVFKEARHSEHSFQYYAKQYRALFKDQPKMYDWILDIMFKVSLADHEIDSEEHELLRVAAKIFGVEQDKFKQIKSKYVKDTSDLSKYYSILGCESGDSLETIKSRYQELAVEYHPEKYKNLDIPEEFVRLAEDKHRAIVEAYTIIETALKVS